MRTLPAHKIVTCLLFLLTVGFVATYGGAQRGAAQTKATTTQNVDYASYGGDPGGMRNN